MDQKIIKSSSWLLIAQASSKAVSFFYTLFLARELGVENFGLYVIALSYFSLVSSIADFGVTKFFVREASIVKNRLENLLSAAIILRLVILSCFFVFFTTVVYFFDSDRFRGSLTVLAILAVLPQSISLTLDAAFIASYKTRYCALGLLTLSISTLVVGVYLIKNGFGVMGAIIGLIIGQLVYALVMILVARVRKMNFFGAVDIHLLKQVVLGSLPYGFLVILGLLYFKIDSLLLGYLRGSYEAGIYGAAYRFLEAVLFIPSAFAATLFPHLSFLHDSNPQQLKKTYFRSLKFFAILSLPVFVGFVFLLPIVLKHFLPLYHSSITALYILSFTIPFIFLHVPGAMVLLSTNKYLKQVIVLSFITLGFNVLLNLIFIPKFGYIAASYITVASEALSFIIFFNLLTSKVFKN